MKIKSLFKILVIAGLLFHYYPGFSQPGYTFCRTVDYSLASGNFDGSDDIHTSPLLVFSDAISIPDAAWIRIYFGEWDLGSNSYLKITSVKDGGDQKLNSLSLRQWKGASAFFNGRAVTIELYVAPTDRDVYFNVNKVVAGKNEPPELGRSICGSTDDRVLSYDDAVGRTLKVVGTDTTGWCTGWIVSNGAHLTAGHCNDAYELEVLEFNIPMSNSNGTLNFADPDDQYAVDDSYVVSVQDPGEIGDDWAVFKVHPNSNTGLLPIIAQNAYYRMSRDISNPGTTRVTGCGFDNSPWSYNQVQQTHTGPNLGETYEGPSDVYWEYQVDTENSNSGSPIIDNSNGITLGIHTNGGCSSTEGNTGTSFENNSLETAIRNSTGTLAVFVDNNHPSTDDGTVLRPWTTVAQGVSDVSTGGILSIVKGVYDETNPLVITKEMFIEAPAGSVIVK